MDKEWPGVKEEAKYQVNWMRNLEFEFPTDKQISSANSCPVPCLKHKDTDVDDRCESHDWQDMRVDICMKKFDMIDKMIGGYVGASLGEPLTPSPATILV